MAHEQADWKSGCLGWLGLAAVAGVIWGIVHSARDPIDAQREAIRKAPLTSLSDGQSFPFNPRKDRARRTPDYSVAGIEECPAGMAPDEIPRVVIRLRMPSTATSVDGAEAAKAEVRKVAGDKRYCAFMVFIEASDKTDIVGDPWVLARYECGPDGRWDAAREAYPRPDYASYDMAYHALADSRMLPAGGR